MTRRELLTSMPLLAVSHAARAGPQLEIRAARLRQQIESLSAHGRPSGGSFSDGVSRIGYSDADIAGRKYVLSLVEAARLKARIDAAGNIFVRKPGTNAALSPVLFGSHIDSVPNGGNFDGDLGSLAAIEVLRVLGENGIVTRRPLEAVVWSCEEATFNGNTLNGSRAAAGKLRPGELEGVSRGLTLSESMRRIGGDPARLDETQLRSGAFHAYLELHIEQGGTLDKEGTSIGIVEGIVALDHYDAVITGMANHAGTTPMADRQDALLAAAQLTLAVREVVTQQPGPQVGTVGHLDVEPNASNVVPGRVRLSIDLRDLSTEKLRRLGEAIRARAAAIGAQTKTQIVLTQTQHAEPALASSEVKAVIQRAAAQLQLSHRSLPSGAVHDAQVMATVGPMGMIFVPSVGGISHSPQEVTSWEDCMRGANVLLQSVLALAA
ncbi:MAG: M20 family metallo-hydrolase [Acidobacteria bacterium]|nr:M20 family metallo-hydrolase [Acidobacteriota bacterium]